MPLWGPFRARFASLSKVVVFCGTFVCTGKGYIERETSLALLVRERGALFRACFTHLSKVVIFCGTFVCTGKGYVEGELLSLRSREKEALFRARFARLSKVVVFLALLNAPVRGM